MSLVSNRYGYKLLEVDFKYSGVNYDYNTSNSCAESGCDSEGICRCGVIQNAHITNIDVNAMSNEIYGMYFDKSKQQIREDKINTVLYGTSKELDIYCIDRVLRNNKIWDESKWDISVVGGYYGEEIGSIKLDSKFSNIQDDIESLLNLNSFKEKVNYLLHMEYGYILPELDGCDYEMSTISRSDAVFGSDGHYRKIQKEDLSHYVLYSGISGIVKKDGDKYKIIDGYHRIYAGGLGKFKNVDIKVILVK